jgi:hypothetical protein
MRRSSERNGFIRRVSQTLERFQDCPRLRLNNDLGTAPRFAATATIERCRNSSRSFPSCRRRRRFDPVVISTQRLVADVIKITRRLRHDLYNLTAGVAARVRGELIEGVTEQDMAACLRVFGRIFDNARKIEDASAEPAHA